MWFLQNPVKSGENVDSKKGFIWLKTILSNILDTWERTLTEHLICSFYFLDTGVFSFNLSWFEKYPLSNEVVRILVSTEM